MDSLYGLIRYVGSWLRLLAFLLLPFILALVVVGQVRADEYTPVAWYNITYNSIVCESYQPSVIEQCTADAYNSTPTYIHSFDYWIHPLPHIYSPSIYVRGLSLKRVVASTGNPASNQVVNVYVQWHCPSGGTINASTGKCENAPPCPDGQSRDAYGQCQSPPCIDGRELDSGFYSSANNPVACIQGCQALRVSTGAPVMNCDLSQGIGVCDYIYPARYVDTGVQCSPSSEPPKETPKPDCPYCRCMESGGSWGQVGGVDTCMPQGSPGSAPVTKPSAPPTVTTTTPAPTPENPDPEPVTEVTPAPVITVTPPPAGAPAGTPPTVTETTTDPETGGTVTTEKDKKSYCQENPTAQICRDDDKSIFSGTCESFRCEGDAIQCAMALKQHQTVCDMQKGDAISDLGQQLTQGLGGVENPLENPEQISLDTLDTSSFMPKGGLQDMSFSIVGQSFTLPLSNLNAGLQFAGYIVLAFSFIAAARIVFM